MAQPSKNSGNTQDAKGSKYDIAACFALANYSAITNAAVHSGIDAAA
jgi:hypothetical protein